MPFTKAVPKELVPAYDRPVIHYAVREAMAAGIERIVIVTARGRRRCNGTSNLNPGSSR